VDIKQLVPSSYDRWWVYSSLKNVCRPGNLSNLSFVGQSRVLKNDDGVRCIMHLRLSSDSPMLINTSEILPDSNPGFGRRQQASEVAHTSWM